MKKTIILTISLLLSTNMWGQFFKQGGLEYRIPHDEKKEVWVNKNVSAKGIVIVPSEIKHKGVTYKVTGIGSSAFNPALGNVNRKIEEIILPSTIRRIQEYAFNGSSISKIVIPEGVDDIEIGTFDDCEKLRKITLPSSLKKIHAYAFHGCKNICDFIIPNSVVYIGEYAFAYCTGLVSVTIPNSVMCIGKRAFSCCKGLTLVTLSSSLEHIPEGAFSDCNNLTSIIIPNSIRTVGDWAFSDCTSLESIVIPYNVYKIGDGAFGGCYSLKQVKGLHVGMTINDDFIGTLFDIRTYKNSFDYYAIAWITEDLKEWLKKREFETNEQYKLRVSEGKRKEKVQELMAEAISIYTQKHPISVTLGNYNADNQSYSLNSNYGQRTIKVPLSDAPYFKQNFNSATFDASYTHTAKGLQLRQLAIKMNGKTYHSEQYNMAIAPTNLDIDLTDFALPVEDVPLQTTKFKPIVQDHALDENIPQCDVNSDNTFAIVIGNERYQRVVHVAYANNDAKIFAEYCKKTLGLPDKNIKLYENATYGTMIGAVSDIQKIAKAFKGDIKVIFYYAGHGIPDEATGDGYLLPIDADGMKTEVCYPLNRLYKEFGDLGAKFVVAFMDACFSGAQRGNGMVVAARGVAIKAKSEHPIGNTVVFTASTDKQTAYPYEEKGHGMFTYYLLKKLRDTKGNCTLGELGSYICDEVAKQAIVTNGKEQTPVVLTSGIWDNWQDAKLR